MIDFLRTMLIRYKILGNVGDVAADVFDENSEHVTLMENPEEEGNLWASNDGILTELTRGSRV